MVLLSTGKGGKNRRRGKNENESEKRELVFKEDGQGELTADALDQSTMKRVWVRLHGSMSGLSGFQGFKLSQLGHLLFRRFSKTPASLCDQWQSLSRRT